MNRIWNGLKCVTTARDRGGIALVIEYEETEVAEYEISEYACY